MKVLLVGETGTGKTYLSLYISQFFDTVYIDTERGTEEWLSSFKFNKKFKVVDMTCWIGDSINIPRAELVVLDSVSELMEHFKDYLQNKIRTEKKYVLPTATGIVDLDLKGYDVDMITMPIQLYSLVYDRIINFVSNCIRSCRNVIVTMHPIETRSLSIDGKIVHSQGRLNFVQSLHRKFDCVMVLKKPTEGYIRKIRGRIVKADSTVNVKEYLANLFKIENNKVDKS